MAQVVPLPKRGEVFLDARGEGRSMRLSWHHEQGVVILSLWRNTLCAGSFRLPVADVPAVIAALVAGLSEGYPSNTSGRADAG